MPQKLSTLSLRRHAPSLAAFASLVAAAAFAAAPGCSSGSSPPPDDSTFDSGGPAADAAPATDAGPLAGLVTITVSPPSASLVAGDGATTQAFTATGKFADGSTRDVTAQVVWNVYPSDLLGIGGTTVSTSGARGGDGTVSAVSGAITGSAPVHVTFTKSVYVNGTAAGAETKFGGPATTSLNPALLYPLDGALFPPNLGPMDVQWTPQGGTSLYDVHIASASIDLHAYTGCNAVGAGCSLVLDAATWSAVTGTLRGADPAAVTIRATDGQGGGVGTSAPANVQLAETDVKGGLYYFNTRGGTLPDGGTTGAGIYRYDFDSAQVGQFYTAGDCAGCHALSNDGTKMLAPICTTERGCARPLQLAVVDVATRQAVTPAMPIGDTDTVAWAPDNKYYLTTPECASIPSDPTQGCAFGGGGLSLIDASNNTFVAKVPTGAGAFFPHFKNGGGTITYARGNPTNGPLSVTGASLFTIDFDETHLTFGAEKPLLASAGATESNYYPNYSPDDAWVLFTRSTCAAGDGADKCDSYDDPSARAMVIPAAGGTPIDLAAANGVGNLDNSWARWSPFNGSYKSGQLLWLTFSTVRDYGVRATTAGDGTHVRQLWIVGFDVGKAQAGKDPSFAPVWLPFQDTAASNHIGQWTTKIVGPVK